MRGPDEFGRAAWPDDVRARVDATRAELDAALRRATRRLPGSGRERRERCLLAVVDLPYAVVRGQEPVPQSAEALVEDAVRAVLTSGG